MIHVDTRQLARFERVGHRITGDRRVGSSRGAGYEKAHVAIDDATRLAYVEVLPDEKQATTVGFVLRAVAWFDDQASAARGFSQITAVPTAPGPGEKPAQHLGSHQNAPGRTPHEPTAKPNGFQDPAG